MTGGAISSAITKPPTPIAVAEAQVDLGEQQDERLGRAEDDEQGGLPEEGDQVSVGQEGGVLDLEKDADRDQRQRVPAARRSRRP